MAVGDEFTLRVVGRYQEQNIVNTLHYRIINQTASDQEILNALLILWETALEVAWCARHIDTYTLVGTKAFGKTGDAKTPAFRPIGTAGAVVGEEVPASVCRTITLYTASTNHRRRGRIMLSGTAVTQLNVNDGSVTVPEQALLTTFGELINTNLSGGGDEAQIILPSTDLLPLEAITDVKGRPTPSLIRSRRIRQFLIG